MTQPNLWDEPSDLDKKFWLFHEHNPQVFKRLVIMCNQAKAMGRKKAGIGMFWEVLRWESYLDISSDDFKLNNSYRSRYARILEQEHPEFIGLFNKRRIKS